MQATPNVIPMVMRLIVANWITPKSGFKNYKAIIWAKSLPNPVWALTRMLPRNTPNAPAKVYSMKFWNELLMAECYFF